MAAAAGAPDASTRDSVLLLTDAARIHSLSFGASYAVPRVWDASSLAIDRKELESLNAMIAALSIAALRGDLRTVEALMACDRWRSVSCDLDAPHFDFQMPALWMAAEQGHLAVVQRLLAHPGKIVSGDSTGITTALAAAASGGHLPLVEYLLARGADPGSRNNEALRRAAAGGHTAVVTRLSAADRADPGASAVETLLAAPSGGHLPVASTLASAHGPAPSAAGSR